MDFPSQAAIIPPVNPYRRPKPNKDILFKGIFMPATALIFLYWLDLITF